MSLYTYIAIGVRERWGGSTVVGRADKGDFGGTNIEMTTKAHLTSAVKSDEFNAALPDDWRGWPTRVELAYTLTLGSAVTTESYSRFRVESLYEAVRYLFDPVYRRRYFRYSLKTDGFLPAYQYDAEWSLLRRGSTGGVSRRKREQRVESWSFGADTTLIEIWRESLTEYTFEGRLWLRTGGRTKDDAVQNWLVSARLLRKVYRLSSELARSPD